MQVQLDRRLSGRRIYPAIDVTQTSTRKEELLLSEFELSRSWILRRILNQMGVVEGMEFLMERMEGTSSNEEFLKAMNGWCSGVDLAFFSCSVFYYSCKKLIWLSERSGNKVKTDIHPDYHPVIFLDSSCDFKI